MTTSLQSIRLLAASPAHYAVRLARDGGDIRAAQALRYKVFNVELREGLDESHATGLDEDPFDAVCDHLVVLHRTTGEVVGTYRMQTGARAAAGRGYYCAEEFEFEPYERLRPEMLELGRACVDRRHRNLVVLGLLWKGIAEYAARHGARYLVGCSSLTSQEPAVGASAYAELCRRHLAATPWRTRPRPDYECPLDELTGETPPLPKLLRAYLNVGAKICGPPALDRRFKTIDFLTMLDLASLPATVRERLFN